MGEWQTHRSAMIPTGVLLRLREEAASPEHLEALMEEWICANDKPQVGGRGELKIKFRVTEKGESDGIGEVSNESKPRT
jgi:hypothetical protein